MTDATSTVVPAITVVQSSSLWGDALVAAVVAGLVSLLVTVFDHGRARRDRLREQYADALRAYAAYREFPYVVRRRTDSGPAERVRISEAFREVQEQLTFAQAWMTLESEAVAREYRKLVDITRDVAGNAIRRAWELSPTTEDQQMNIPEYADDLKRLNAHEDAYIEAARRRLGFWAIFRG
jgi:hypothetical protein